MKSDPGNDEEIGRQAAWVLEFAAIAPIPSGVWGDVIGGSAQLSEASELPPLLQVAEVHASEEALE